MKELLAGCFWFLIYFGAFAFVALIGGFSLYFGYDYLRNFKETVKDKFVVPMLIFFVFGALFTGGAIYMIWDLVIRHLLSHFE